MGKFALITSALDYKHVSGTNYARKPKYHCSLKQRKASSPLLFNFSLEYAIRKIHENQVGLKLNMSHKLLIYADNVNLLRDNINTINRNKDALIDANRRLV
jgi:hypothetical protein